MKITQRQKILDHLEENNHIGESNWWFARHICIDYRARISELRRLCKENNNMPVHIMKVHIIGSLNVYWIVPAEYTPDMTAIAEKEIKKQWLRLYETGALNER